MTFWILAAALFILPLSNVIILEPIISITHNAKETLALIFCLAFSIYVFNSGKSNSNIINKSLSALIFSLIVSINASPKISLIYNYTNIGNLWEWKPFAIALIYYLFYLSFSNIRLSLKDKENLCKVIGLTAIISSIYAIFQALGLDQAQSVKTIQQIGSPDAPGITAMIGNPTHLSIYLVACMPFVWQYFKKYLSLTVIVAIVLCGSDTGYLGLALMGLVWLFSKCDTKKKIRTAIMLVGLLIGLSFGYLKNYNLADNGRFNTWKQAISEFYNPALNMPITKEMSESQKAEVRKLNSKKYVMTGLGMGSFPIIHNAKANVYQPASLYASAHNIYLEILFSIGIIGLLLFLASLFECFYNFFCNKIKNKSDFLIFISFIFLLLASCLHSTILVEPLRFLMAFLFCLISFR